MYSVYLIPSLVSKAVPFSASFALQNLLLRIIISEYVAKYIHDVILMLKFTYDRFTCNSHGIDKK
jgi:hypothetical protein